MTLTNTSSRTCTVYGYPGLQLIGAGGAKIPTDTHRGPTFFTKDPGPHLIVLQHGQSAWSGLETLDVEGPGESCDTQTTSLAIIPPDETTSLTVPYNVRPCQHGRIDETALQAGSGPT